MTSLTLTLDNVDVSDNTDEINKLFPKCKPRSDINLNPVLSSIRDHDHSNNITSTMMNVEADINNRYKSNIAIALA